MVVRVLFRHQCGTISVAFSVSVSLFSFRFHFLLLLRVVCAHVFCSSFLLSSLVECVVCVWSVRGMRRCDCRWPKGTRKRLTQGATGRHGGKETKRHTTQQRETHTQTQTTREERKGYMQTRIVDAEWFDLGRREMEADKTKTQSFLSIGKVKI